MKTNFNSTDGFYFFVLILSFALSFWFGDFLRMKIQSSNWNHKLSIFTGVVVEVLTMIVGVYLGFVLVKILATTP
jgi:hypothetical protein